MFNNAWNEDGYLKLSAFLKFLFLLFALYISVFYAIPEAYDAIIPKPFRFEDFKTTQEMREFLEKRYVGKNINDVIPELEKVGVSYFRKDERSIQSYQPISDTFSYYNIKSFSEYTERCSGEYYGEYRHNYFRPGWEFLRVEYEFSLFLDKQENVFGVWAWRRVAGLV